MSRILAGGLAAGLLVAALPASAHVTLETPDAKPGAYYKAVLKVGHGCSGSPTTALSVDVPDGLVTAKPQPKPGWTLDIVSGAYGQGYQMHGKSVTEGTRRITWSGGSLPEGQYDEFVFVAYLPTELAGQAIPVPVVQTCQSGEHRWVEVAAKPGEKPASPAPVVRIAQAGAAAPAAAAPATSIKAGDLTLTTPWARATLGGAKVGGGYVTITNTGKTADRLVGGSLVAAGRFEVHEMAMKDGIMTMRPLEKGLEIPAGGTVELKPGGLHLMFMDLKQPLKEGEAVSGTLVFEKAGTVSVNFDVRGIGAGAGSAPAPAHGAAGGHQH